MLQRLLCDWGLKEVSGREAIALYEFEIRFTRSVCLRLVKASIFLLLFVQMAWSEARFDKTMAWSAYNLGTTGYNQSVAIGKVLKDHYGVNLRVLPAKNDVSRLLPLIKGRVQFSANGVSTYFAQEGIYQFAAKNWGPLKVRLLMTSNGESNQSLGVAADQNIRSFSDLRGKRVPYVRGAPAVNVPTEAFLACGGLSWSDVKRVNFPGYNAMWNGLVNNKVDAAYANTVSGPARKAEASPRGLFWPPANHDDLACWNRMLKVVPFLLPHVATRGAAISQQEPHEGATYPYPILITMDRTEDEIVRDLTEVIHIHYEEFKDADPGSIGWAMNRQIFDWVVPYHSGAVSYFRSVGVWSEEYEQHNLRLIKRQEVLAEAWNTFSKSAESKADNFREAWLIARVEALEHEGMDPAGP